MSDVASLWNRIEEAKRRLGAADEGEIKRLQEVNAQVKEVRAGVAERYRELERHREEVATLRQENEQLRRMLHRLLLAIEQRSTAPLRDIVKDLEGEVGALVPLMVAGAAGGEAAKATAKTPPQAAPPAETNPASPRGPRAAEAAPSERDSRWLQEIMERARELTAEDHAPTHTPIRTSTRTQANAPAGSPTAPAPSHGAVA